MKKSLLFPFLALCLASCQNDSSTIPTKHITFRVNGDFATSFEDMTRASMTGASLTDLWIYDYAGGSLVQQAHKVSTDADFASPSLTLSYGTHHVKFIASKSVTPSYPTGEIAWQKVSDTFTLDYTVEVKASTSSTRTVELKRAITGITLVNTDAVPANAKSIDIHLSRHYASLNIVSLLAQTSDEFVNSFDYLSTDVGSTGIKLNTFSLCPSAEEWTTDVSVTVKTGTGATLSSFAVENVPLMVNRKTVLSGEVFNRSNGFAISVDDSWDAAEEIEF